MVGAARPVRLSAGVVPDEPGFWRVNRIAQEVVSVHTKCMVTLDSCSAHTTHPAEAVFARWAEPQTWPDWDEGVRRVWFSGPATVGAEGRMRPPSGPAVSFSVTALEPGRVFTNASSMPGAKLVFEHLVTPVQGGSVVEVTVWVEGPLARVWARILGKNLGSAAQSSVEGLLAHLDRP